MIIGGKYIDGTTLASYKMYDIHTHLIPGVDDGAWDIATADSMLSLSSMEGIQKIIVTPHSSAFEVQPKLVRERYKELQQLVSDKYKEIEIHMGCELRCSPKTIKSVIDGLEDGTYPSMAGSRYVLIEFYANVLPDEAKFCVGVLKKYGWIPILAHIERYPKLFGLTLITDKSDGVDAFADRTLMNEYLWSIRQLKSMDCLIQLNISSVCQELDYKTAACAAALLNSKLVDFLGTDAHDCGARPPRIEIGLAHLYKYYEDEYVTRIAYKNAEQVWNGKSKKENK